MRLTPLEVLRALIALARLCVITKFRLRGRYWTWRRATAFGSGEGSIPLLQRLHSVLEFGAWAAKMRRISR
ncbi:MAG: hypothetical protein EXS03_08200 [Phycisphaerales bacterium]|nr:hypothetical protein [Phycisphaerales bacterium]